MEPTIHLIGVGTQRAKLASDVRVGDHLVWNFGSISEVRGVTREGGMVTMQVSQDGHTYAIRKRCGTLVAYLR